MQKCSDVHIKQKNVSQCQVNPVIWLSKRAHESCSREEDRLGKAEGDCCSFALYVLVDSFKSSGRVLLPVMKPTAVHTHCVFSWIHAASTDCLMVFKAI